MARRGSFRALLDEHAERIGHPELRDLPVGERGLAVRYPRRPSVPAEASPASPAAMPDYAAEQRRQADLRLAQRIIEAASESALDVLNRHVFFPSRAIETVAVLWPLHALARREDKDLIWPASPRWMVTSGESQSGKSVLMDIEAMICGSTFGRIPRVSAPAYGGIVGKMHEVAFLDEAKLIFGSGQKSADVQAMILNGYTPRTNTVIMLRGIPTGTSSWGATMYAGKDQLLMVAHDSDSVHDMLDRTIITRMIRAPRLYPDPDEDTIKLCKMINVGFSTWTGIMRPALLAAHREITEEELAQGTMLSGRDIADGKARKVQIWKPLEAVARVMGDPWTERCEAARNELSVNDGVVVSTPSFSDAEEPTAEDWFEAMKKIRKGWT